MKITFHGAARTTTGSMHLLELNGKRILLDAGLYQGKRKEAFERNRNLPFDPSSIDLVLLSHAHIDHSGNLPSLVRGGFEGGIVATPATRDLCDIMLADSAYLQTREVEYVNRKRERDGKRPFEPLYTKADVEQTLKRFAPLTYGTPREVVPGLTVTYHDAGHILGSALMTLDISHNGSSKRLLFTGDLGRPDMPILKDPKPVSDVNYIITESTYGARRHPVKADIQGRLKGFIEDIVRQRAKLIIPSFSVGRTQQLVYFLNELHEEGRIPPVPIYVDSPLAVKATTVYDDHQECWDKEAYQNFISGDRPFEFRGLTYVTETADSKALNRQDGPLVIISASGMCEGGRILHHLRNGIEDPRNIILFIGYQAKHTLGRRIVEQDDPIRIFGESYDLNARVHTINALSAHADADGIVDFLRPLLPDAEEVFVVHGEEEAATALAKRLEATGAGSVTVPIMGETARID